MDTLRQDLVFALLSVGIVAIECWIPMRRAAAMDRAVATRNG